MNPIKSPKTDRLFSFKEGRETRAEYMKEHTKDVILEQIRLEYNKRADTLPRYMNDVNHKIFNGQSLKTDTFLFFHEKEFYTPELEELVLNFMRQCVVALKKEESASELAINSDFFEFVQRNEKELHHKIFQHIKKKTENPNILQINDRKLTQLIEPILLPDIFVYLQQIIKEKNAFINLTNAVNFNDPEVLTTKNFLENLDKLIQLYNENQYAELLYISPIVQKLAAIFQQFPQDKLDLMVLEYGSLFNKAGEEIGDNQSLLFRMSNHYFENYKENEKLSNFHPTFEAWGHYLISSPVFEVLEASEKKDLIYTILKNYSPNHREHSAYDPVLISTCCDLYSNQPELLEYRSVSVILELLKTNPIEHNQTLIDKIKPLIPLIPDTPPIEEHESVRAMLYQEGYTHPLSVYESLMPVFESYQRAGVDLSLEQLFPDKHDSYGRKINFLEAYQKSYKYAPYKTYTCFPDNFDIKIVRALIKHISEPLHSEIGLAALFDCLRLNEAQKQEAVNAWLQNAAPQLMALGPNGFDTDFLKAIESLKENSYKEQKKLIETILIQQEQQVLSLNLTQKAKPSTLHEKPFKL